MDSSPLKVFAASTCKTREVYVRYMEAVDKDAHAKPFLPYISWSEARDATALLGCMKLSDLQVGLNCSDPHEFRFLLLRFDGARVNESMFMHICSEASVNENLLVLGIVC